MSNVNLSAIVPVFNAETTISRCIESIISQTYRPLEILLVDDGSKDGSLMICQEYAQRYNNISVLCKPNTGVSDTRNAGIMAASGEYIIFVDSDDFIDRGMCKDLVNIMESKSADLCVCTVNTIKNGIKHTEHIKEETVCGIYDIASKVFEIYKTNYINSPCNKLYKRRLITTLFQSHVSLGEDLLFNLDYLDNCQKVCFVDKPFYNYEFSNDQSLSSRYRHDSFEIATMLYKRIRDFGVKHGVEFEKMESAREVYMNMIFYSVQDLFYYTKMSHAEKVSMLKKWLNNQFTEEVCKNPGGVSLQQRYAAYLMARKAFNSLAVMFRAKKLISLAAGGKEEVHG